MAIDPNAVNTTAGVPPSPSAAPSAPISQPQPAAQPSQPTQPSAAASAATVAKNALSSPVKSFMAGMLQHLAGTPENDYSVDENGKTVATPEKRTTGGALRNLVSNALAGLAAGAQVQTGKSGLASALAGAGAGAGAVQKKLSDADQLKRKQSADEFEQQQRAIVQRANIAHLNASTLATHFGNIKAGNDLNPSYKKNQDFVDAINESPDLDGVARVMTDAEVARLHQTDPAFLTNHAVLPLGRVPNLDSDGNPVLDAQGRPTSTAQLAVIDGAHEGKLTIPASLADDVQKYGGRAGIGNAEAFTEGSEIPLNKVIAAMSAIGVEKKAELQGWANAEQVWTGKDGKTPMMHNKVMGSGPDAYKPAAQDANGNWIIENVKNEPAESAATVAEKGAAAKKDLAEAGKASADTAATNGDVMKITAQQLVEGNEDPTQLTKRSKSYDATLAAANAYSIDKYGKPFDIAKAQSDYKFSTNVQTQNTLKYLNSLTGGDNKSGNLGALVDLSNKIKRTQFPSINDARAWAKLQTGDPQMAAYYATVTEVADQVAKIMQGGSGGGTSDAKLKQASELFDKGFTKQQIQSTATTLRTLLGNRKTEMIGDNRYLVKQYGGATSGNQGAGITVTDPRGVVHSFPDQASADNFKKLAGIR